MAYPEEPSQYAIYSTNYQYHILELCSYISTSTTYQNIIAISPELAYRKIQNHRCAFSFLTLDCQCHIMPFQD